MLSEIVADITIKGIANKMIEEAFTAGSVCFLKKIFKEDYKNKLVEIIYKTMDQYEREFPVHVENEKIPFYHSQILFEELNRYILFQKNVSHELLLQRFNENSNVIIPTKEELERFYCIFIENIESDKKIKKLFINENFREEVFNLSALVEKLNFDIQQIKETLIFNPNEEWFVQQNTSAIVDLGNRYSPELNFSLPEVFVFDGIGRTENFKLKAAETMNTFLGKGNEILRIIKKAGSGVGEADRFDSREKAKEIKELKDGLEELATLFDKIDFLGTEKIDEEVIIGYVNNLSVIANDIKEYCWEQKEGYVEKRVLDKISLVIRSIDAFIDEKYHMNSFFKSAAFKLSNQPILVLSGDAGIGKSHLAADIVTKRNEQEYESILLLGQQFLETDNPWAQIFKLLQINTTKENFLNVLNARAEKNKKRIIVFIDAINEGRGKYFWPSFINGFINEFEKYPWLGLVITIRSSYIKLIFGEMVSQNYVEYTWKGFQTYEYEASKWFFEKYGIVEPSIPILTPEFRNALFLKLFCESIKKAGLKKIPKEMSGITSIIDLWISSANTAIAKPNVANYSPGFNLVKRAIDVLVNYEYERNVRSVPYEKAYELVQKEVSPYTDEKNFLELIISEGILTKNVLGESDEESVYITYERFEDHLIVRYLLDLYTNLDKEFAENGALHQFVKDTRSLNIYKGIIEAFSIQIPEQKGREFFEYIDEKYRNSHEITTAFVESISWRKYDSYTDQSYDYINSCVFSWEDTTNSFYEMIISVATIPNHPFNANALHRHLFELSMAERDAGWTQILRNIFYEQSAIERLIEWAWNNYEDRINISDKAIELAAITLAWFLTSTIRKLRDISTKGLVCLLKGRLDVLLTLLEKFENVNDPYVYERLYATAYSCVLMTEQKDKIKGLSEYIYITIFKDKEEIYPNVLIRDYARGIIEYANYLKVNLSFDMLEVRPPYKSSLSDKVMSNEEIDSKYFRDIKDTDPKWYYSQNRIIHSMVTEYGRGTGGYGDFGRYVFQSALRSFDVNVDEMSNLAVEWIFEKYGYNVHMHGKYDREVLTSTREYSEVERIGKKYQWIALYEILARVSDNCKKYSDFGFSRQTEEPFEGPWDMFIRKVDPTMIFKHKDGQRRESINWWEPNVTVNWNLPDKEWTSMTDDLPEYSEWIKVEDADKEKWLVLQAYPNWNDRETIAGRDSYPYKEYWSQIRSYLVKNKDFNTMKEWFINQDFMGRWMPESVETSEIFYRELYWSPIYNEFMKNYYEGTEWCDIEDQETREVIGQAIVTTEEYHWSPGEDRSMSEDDGVDFLIPRKCIFDGMGLKLGNREGEFLNKETNEIASLSVNNFYDSKLYLLVKEEPFKEFLEKNDLKIIWTILGEKNIITGGFGGVSRVEISGAYYYEESEVKGGINKKIVRY